MSVYAKKKLINNDLVNFEDPINNMKMIYELAGINISVSIYGNQEYQ